MWRLVFLAILASACGRAAKRAPFVVIPGDLVTVSTDGGAVECTAVPAVAVARDLMLVTWAVQRDDDELGDHVTVRRFASDASVTGQATELGRGFAPTVAAEADGFVVAWRPPGTGASLGFALVAVDSAGGPSGSVVAAGADTSGTPTLASVAGAITGLACSADHERLIVVRDPFAAAAVEQFVPRSGCNDVRAAKSQQPGIALAAVQANEFRGTELVEVHRASVRSAAFLDGHCDDVMVRGNEVILVCMNEPDASRAFIRRTDGKNEPVDVDLGGSVFELRAVALTDGILIAWTIEIAGGLVLRAAVVGLDGRVLSEVASVGPEPAHRWFDLVGDGTSAWVVYVTERQIDERRYRDDVVLVPLTVNRI